MNKNPTGNYSMAKTGTDDDFDMMGDSPSENPVLAEVDALSRRFSSALTSAHFSAVVCETMKSPRNSANTF